MKLLYLLDLVGVGVFAVSGALSAGRARLDLLGVVVIATVTAIGGGTLRDLLLDRHPVFWIADPTYLVVIFGCALLTVPWVRMFRPPYGLLQIADALGLALFSIAGSRLAESLSVPGLIIVVMGVVTGVAGGVIRDVLCNQVPMIFRKGSLYALAAVAGAALYVLLQTLGVARELAALSGMATVAAIRFGAIAWGWSLPEFELPEHADSSEDRR